ncbi:MAG: phosphonate ABC transporter substrate-binding protein, partial [Deltaproteobacteria bacterium CG_4_8_14_3_um_filter_45_9]
METWKKWIIGLASLFSWTFLFSPSPILSRQVIPFGLCPKYNPRIMYQLYQPFIDYLNEATPYRFEIKLSRVYQDTIDRLGSGEIIIASCGPVSYIKASEKYPVKPILRALNKDGKPYYRGIIIVREGSEIHNLSDLKGRSFAFGQAWSTASHILPEYYLSKANIKLKDLKHYDFLRHHDSVANAVLKGQFDAGAVKDIVAYKYRKDGLRFIFMTDPIPTVPIVVRVNAPQEMVKSVKTALLNLNLKDPNCQKKMTRWDEEFK